MSQKEIDREGNEIEKAKEKRISKLMSDRLEVSDRRSNRARDR